MRRAILGSLIAVIVVGGILMLNRSVLLNRPVPTSEAGAGKPLPAQVRLQYLNTKEKVGFEKFAGKVLLINFWATWCEACIAEMPGIQKLFDQFKDKGLQVIAVNVDEHPEKVVPGVIQKLNLTFPVVSDTDGVLSRAFDVVAIPYSIVADRHHKVAWAEAGERDWSSDKVVAEIRKLLEPI